MSELRLTNSESKAWRRCKRKWYLGQYRGLQKKGTTFNDPLSIGTRVHAVLAEYYVPGEGERPDPMDFFRAGVERDVEENPAYEDDIRKEADLCRAMLEGYFEWLEEEGEDHDLRVVAPEAEVEVPLIEGATLLSKIDARIERISDNARGALEHKTVGSLTEPLKILQVDTQLLTEHLVEYMTLLADEGETDDPERNRASFAIYNMLRKVKRSARAKPPFFGREPVSHNVTELRNHWRHVVRVAEEIMDTKRHLDAGADHHDLCPPSPTRDCKWDCSFRDVCLAGLIDDGSDYEAAFEELFEVGDPLERYRSSVGLPSRAEEPASEAA